MFVIKRQSSVGRISYFTKSELGWTENINHAYKCFFRASAVWLKNTQDKRNELEIVRI